jgi:3-hydroxyisobutyrate dehydrogenase
MGPLSLPLPLPLSPSLSLSLSLSLPLSPSPSPSLSLSLPLSPSLPLPLPVSPILDATVGFIGLGNMGGHMANNLLKAGKNVIVNDISETSVANAIANGASSAATPAEVAAKATTIVTMLPSSPHVRTVYEGENGIFSTVIPGTLLIDSSTIDTSTARDVSAKAAEHNARMIDAPVSGGVGGAEAGTLTFMVGAEVKDFEEARQYLDFMGKNIVHCGAVGTGQAAKIANNLVLAISMIGVSEGMNLGVKLGTDPKVLANIFNTSSARCWSSDTYNPCPGVMDGVPASRGYTGGFGVDLMKKDLGLAMNAAADVKASLPLGSLTNQIYGLLSAHGNGKRDFSSVYEWLSKIDESK